MATLSNFDRHFSRFRTPSPLTWHLTASFQKLPGSVSKLLDWKPDFGTILPWVRIGTLGSPRLFDPQWTPLLCLLTIKRQKGRNLESQPQYQAPIGWPISVHCPGTHLLRTPNGFWWLCRETKRNTEIYGVPNLTTQTSDLFSFWFPFTTTEDGVP